MQSERMTKTHQENYSDRQRGPVRLAGACSRCRMVVGGLWATAAEGQLAGENWPAWRGTARESPTNKHLPVVWSETRERAVADRAAGRRQFLADRLGQPRLPHRRAGRRGKTPGPVPGRRQRQDPVADRTVAGGSRPPSIPRPASPRRLPPPTASASTSSSTRPAWSRWTCRARWFGRAAWGRSRARTTWAASPVLYKDMVIQCCDHRGPVFLVALERSRGEERWRTPRKSSGFGHFGTPLLIQVQGRPQLVVNGEPVVAYDPDTGKELWSCRGMKECVAPSPAFGHGLVYASSGRIGPVMAIDPTRARRRDRDPRPHALDQRRSLRADAPGVSAPDGAGRQRPNALLRRRRASSSWKIASTTTSAPRRSGRDGKIYWCSERGKTYVIDASQAGRRQAVGQGAGGQSAQRRVPGNAGDRRRPAVHPHQRGTVLHRRNRKSRGWRSPARRCRGTFAELKKRYEQHQADWQNEPEAQIRLETLEAIARLDDPQVIPFLLHTVQKEPHWDICEEAAKSLGRKGDRRSIR